MMITLYKRSPESEVRRVMLCRDNTSKYLRDRLSEDSTPGGIGSSLVGQILDKVFGMCCETCARVERDHSCTSTNTV